MQRLNRLIDRFERGEFAIGPWIPVGDYRTAQTVGDSSADFCILDMEHTGFDFPSLATTLQWMLGRRTAGRTPVPATPIVRVPPNASERNQWVIKQTLDHGPFGVLQPHAVHAADIAAAVEAMRYPQGPAQPGPVGHRGWMPRQAMRYWGTPTVSDYLRQADLYPLRPHGELLFMLLVEDVESWERIDELVAVPGVGAVLWGPGDGSLSLGVIPGTETPELAAFRRKVVSACKTASVPVGYPSPADLIAVIDEGFDFAAVASWDEEKAAAARDHAGSRRVSPATH